MGRNINHLFQNPGYLAANDNLNLSVVCFNSVYVRKVEINQGRFWTLTNAERSSAGKQYKLTELRKLSDPF